MHVGRTLKREASDGATGKVTNKEGPTVLTRAGIPQSHYLSQIVFLLWVLALAVVLAFSFLASSLCITILLSCFLAILVDPVIMFFERFRVSRMVSSALVIAAGTAVVGALTYHSYRQFADVLDDMPTYAQRVGQTLAPVMKKIQKVEDSAGRLGSEVPTKKIPEVKVKGSYPDWTTYVVRGVGPVSGAAMIMGVVPFLMFFLLLQKRRLKQKLAILWGDKIDVSAFATNVTEMIRGFVLGNLVIGIFMAAVTIGLLVAFRIDGAMVLGAVSGFLNLIPFLGAILGALIPIGAGLIQNEPLSALAVIFVTVVVLHTVSVNFLVPKIIGERVSISPVAATVGILFWGWLWGVVGVLLAVPLTALVKILADLDPSLRKFGNLLAEHPVGVPPWSRASAVAAESTEVRERPVAQIAEYEGKLKDTHR